MAKKKRVVITQQFLDTLDRLVGMCSRTQVRLAASELAEAVERGYGDATITSSVNAFLQWRDPLTGSILVEALQEAEYDVVIEPGRG